MASAIPCCKALVEGGPPLVDAIGIRQVQKKTCVRYRNDASGRSEPGLDVLGMLIGGEAASRGGAGITIGAVMVRARSSRVVQPRSITISPTLHGFATVGRS